MVTGPADPDTAPSDVLIACIGNRNRGDDGVAHAVAERLREGGLRPGVVLGEYPQLDVALAAEAAEVGLFVVVDAERRSAPAVHVAELTPRPGGRSGHSVDPGELLGIAEALYGRAPRAVLVSVAAPVMEHAEGLSAVARQAADEAAVAVLELLAAG